MGYSSASYHQQLEAILQKKQIREGQPVTGSMSRPVAQGMHVALCKQVFPGMTEEEIVKDWNRRSPGDPWKWFTEEDLEQLRAEREGRSA